MILVVDDHNMVLKLVEKFLEKEGLQSALYTDPIQALDFLSKNQDKIKLLIVDIFMPLMDGKEFAHKALEINNDIPILMISATTYDTILNDETLKNRVHFFRKPFPQDKFISYIKKLI